MYDRSINPGAAAWFKPSARVLITRVDGYLKILDAHGIRYEKAQSSDPGRVVYEDEYQIVVVPRI